MDLKDEGAKVIVDRGFVDCLCWIMWFRTTGRIDARTAKSLEELAMTSQWFDKTALTVVLRCQFSTALHRRGREGQILNTQTFVELRNAYDLAIEQMLKKHSPPLLLIETDQLTPFEVRDQILERIASLDAL